MIFISILVFFFLQCSIVTWIYDLTSGGDMNISHLTNSAISSKSWHKEQVDFLWGSSCMSWSLFMVTYPYLGSWQTPELLPLLTSHMIIKLFLYLSGILQKMVKVRQIQWFPYQGWLYCAETKTYLSIFIFSVTKSSHTLGWSSKTSPSWITPTHSILADLMEVVASHSTYLS